MAMEITVKLSDVDEKCIRYFAADPEEWINNFIQARVFAAKQEIYHLEVRRMTADPEIKSIPADVNTVVSEANIRYANTQPEIPSMMAPQN
jgi:hypothetical protein